MCISEAQIIIIKQKHCSVEHLSNYPNTLRNYNTHVLRTPFTAINQKAFTISFHVLKAYGGIHCRGLNITAQTQVIINRSISQ